MRPYGTNRTRCWIKKKRDVRSWKKCYYCTMIFPKFADKSGSWIENFSWSRCWITSKVMVDDFSLTW